MPIKCIDRVFSFFFEVILVIKNLFGGYPKGNIPLKKKRIIISKIERIGDVTFALPLASELKKIESDCTILFLGRKYTQDLVEAYSDVDEFIDWDLLSLDGPEKAAQGLSALQADVIIHVSNKKEVFYAAKKAQIPLRIGSTSKFFNWLTCNHLVKIQRRYSDLHEIQLDMMMLKSLGGKSHYSLEKIISLRHYKPFKNDALCLNLLDKNKFNLILHPKTAGEHIEWAPEKFAELIALLPSEEFNIFITGSAKEGGQVEKSMIEPFSHVINLCGKTTLNDLMQLIAKSDGLICASTGAIHLSANFGIPTLGLYAPIEPFDSVRWGPVGKNSQTLSIEGKCDSCRYNSKCRCVNEITPQQVLEVVLSWSSILTDKKGI